MKLLVIALTLLTAGLASAEIDAAQKALLDRLFAVTKQKESYEKAMTSGFDAATQSDMIPDEQKEKMKAGMERVKTLMLEKMGWDVMKPEMYALYAKHYTIAELEEIVPALETEEAKKFFAKGIVILPQAMALGQEKAATLQGDIQKIMMEEMMK